MSDCTSSIDFNKTKKQRLDNVKAALIGHLNRNSFRNKFVLVEDEMKLFEVFIFLNHN